MILLSWPLFQRQASEFSLICNYSMKCSSAFGSRRTIVEWRLAGLLQKHNLTGQCCKPLLTPPVCDNIHTTFLRFKDRIHRSTQKSVEPRQRKDLCTGHYHTCACMSSTSHGLLGSFRGPIPRGRLHIVVWELTSQGDLTVLDGRRPPVFKNCRGCLKLLASSKAA